MADATAIQRYFGNWDIIQNLSTKVPWPYPKDGAETFIRNECLPKMEKEESFVWAITLKIGPDEAIGLIDFRFGENPLGNRGFWIAKQFQGQGYMTEAVAITTKFLFEYTNIESFKVMNSKLNIGSRRVKEKTGAVFLNTIELAHHNGQKETEVWEVTKENWLKSRDF